MKTLLIAFIVMLLFSSCAVNNDLQENEIISDNTPISNDNINTVSNGNIKTEWVFKDTAVGSLDDPSIQGSIIMSETIILSDGTYRMYYTHTQGQGNGYISYVESEDGENWEYKGDALQGSSDAESPLYIIGGPRVLSLDDGSYRMYFRASKSYEEKVGKPFYKTYSATSEDGLTFTLEDGVRIDTYPEDSSSPFDLAGHGAFFKRSDGVYAGIISADPVNSQGASDLYYCSSEDGIEWDENSCTLLYEDFHDPVVIQYNGLYYIFTKYLRDNIHYGVSSDGITWSKKSELIPLTFYNENGEDISDDISDVGAFIATDGTLRITSNMASGDNSPSKAIGIFAEN